LGPGLGRDDDVGEPGGLVLEGGNRYDEGAGERLPPSVGVGMGADRVRADEQYRPELVCGEAVLDRGTPESGVGLAQPGLRTRQAADLAQAPPIRLLRDLEQARADALVHLADPGAGEESFDRARTTPEPLPPDDRLVGRVPERL